MHGYKHEWRHGNHKTESAMHSEHGYTIHACSKIIVFTQHIYLRKMNWKSTNRKEKKTWTYRKRKRNPQKIYKKWYSMISLAYIHNNRNFILLVASPVISVNAMSDTSLYSPCPKTAAEAPWGNETYLILHLAFFEGGGSSHQVNMLLN